MVEDSTDNRDVVGSNPTIRTKTYYKFYSKFFNSNIDAKEVDRVIMNINIKSVEDAEKLNREVCKTSENLWVHSKDNLVMIDARSLLGLFSLIGKPCRLVAEDYANPKVLANVAKQAGVL